MLLRKNSSEDGESTISSMSLLMPATPAMLTMLFWMPFGISSCTIAWYVHCVSSGVRGSSRRSSTSCEEESEQRQKWRGTRRRGGKNGRGGGGGGGGGEDGRGRFVLRWHKRTEGIHLPHTRITLERCSDEAILTRRVCEPVLEKVKSSRSPEIVPVSSSASLDAASELAW